MLRENIPTGTRVLVCGSTLAGEEEMLLDDCARRWGYGARATAPGAVRRSRRNPDANVEYAGCGGRNGCRLQSTIEPGTVFLLDSIGELASVYSLAEAAFVGGSLIPAGGHNPLEAAQFAVPIMMGPSYENFRAIVEKLREHEAIRIVQPADLKAELARILADATESRAMGTRAREVFENEAGATERAVQALVAVVTTRAPVPASEGVLS